MKRIYVNPLKSVNDVQFGASRRDVRRAFGPYKEFKESSDSAEMSDDFRYCKVHYENGGMAAVEVLLPECSINVGNKVVDTTNANLCKKSFGMTESCDKSKQINISVDAAKIKSITFGRPGYYTEAKEEDEEEKKPVKEDTVTEGPGLMDTYASIKGDAVNSNPLIGTAPTGDALHIQMGKKCNQLKDNCYKHLLLDIYCKILPLDKDYIDGHMGQLKGDVNAMLQNKGMTPTQYMTACYSSTKAPMLEFVMRSVNKIGGIFYEETIKDIEKDQEAGMDIPMPEIPDDPTADEEVNSQLVDIKDDIDYGSFVDILKKKTIEKIVDDVTKIINDKEEDSEMNFDPKPPAEIQEELESTTSVGMTYLQQHLYNEKIDVTGMTEDLLGLAIRESALNQFDKVFNLPGASFMEFASKIRFGKGVIINESTVSAIAKEVKSSNETKKIIDDANKERDNKINAKLKASDVIDAKEDDEDKK